MAQEYKPIGGHFYDGIQFSESFPAEQLQRIKNFEFFDDDVLIATYPKAGETVAWHYI